MNQKTFAGPRAFARWALEGGRLQLLRNAGAMRMVEQMAGHGHATELTLFQDGPWQISLVTLTPGSVVLPHRHARVSSVDLVIGGGGFVSVAPCVRRRGVQACAESDWSTQLQRIPSGAVHGGEVGPDGAAFLSFQQWAGEPSFIADDWEWVHG